ncbi:MAG: hypothetical protein PHU99_10220, partial [Candidatus Cloacimonetes bacterium]|nr:hypothetical protein [Candidatus Cloacimonadota bacterium]
EPDMAGLPDGVWRGCGDDHRASPLYETEYHGGASASFLPDIGEQTKAAPPAGFNDLFCGTNNLLLFDHYLLVNPGLVDFRNSTIRAGINIRIKIPTDPV